MTTASITIVPPGFPAGIIDDGADTRADAGAGAGDDVCGLLRAVRTRAAQLDRDKLRVVGRALREGTFEAGREEAEHRIVAHARDNQPGPGELRRYARGVITELDQDGPAPPEPRQRHELWLRRDPEGGGGTVNAILDAAGFAAVETALDALTRHDNNGGGSDHEGDEYRSVPGRRADALVELAEFCLTRNANLADVGGERPQVHVLMRLADLEGRGRGLLLDHSGDSLTAAQLRRMLCDCGVIPHVLGGDGQPLDIGRATRVIPAGIRRAVVLRDRGCAFPGCDRKPARCECHHVIEWFHGGPTAVDNLVLLCMRHHKLIHKASWEVRIRDGTPEFVPPTWVDPRKRPRRKPRTVERV
jgi:uncharacterized protein DUF222/HNH endonuclease